MNTPYVLGLVSDFLGYSDVTWTQSDRLGSCFLSGKFGGVFCLGWVFPHY